jgi:hydrogenase expression/formation protein HypD|tara:strand:+ start:856 stop:1983 length:1128 start_codon:yes stop_codon:yes gene_type:complete
MKYLSEFRDPVLADKLLNEIKIDIDLLKYSERKIRMMEVCGGHTHTIFKYGLEQLLPKEIELIHGPGCPVCVLPINKVDECVELAEEKQVILTTFGDAIRVPGSKKSLLQAKAEGADIRIVYSPMDALDIAVKNPGKDVVFFALGFETTMPSTALTVQEAKKQEVLNFSILCNHITIPQTLKALLDTDNLNLDAFIGPGHVNMIIGTEVYGFIVNQYKKPIVVSGFEPLDILQSISMLIKQLLENRCEIENQYKRVVSKKGNIIAQEAINNVYQIKEYSEWRGLGLIPESGVMLRNEYELYDAEKKYDLKTVNTPDPEKCQCGEVLQGFIKPYECKLFGKECTPHNPIGALMVSSEGSCAAYYNYKYPSENSVIS